MEAYRLVQWSTLGWLAPELLLIVGASLMYLVAAFVRLPDGRWSIVGAVLLAAAMAVKILFEPALPASPYSGPLALDSLGELTRWLALFSGLVMTLMMARDAHGTLAAEQAATLIFAVAGIMVLGRANDLITLFLALETISIPTYVLLFLGGRSRESSEATLKYFFLSVMSSGLLLYGLSFLYGMTGAIQISGGPQSLHAALLDSPWQSLAPLALILTLAGLGFKIAAVPFHFYAPDVYQGANNMNAAVLSVAPKIGGMVALARLAFAGSGPDWDLTWQTLLVLSIVTMTIGNVCALWQNHIRRLLAFSSIAHAGYMLIGLAAAQGGGAVEGAAATMFYLTVYCIATIGAFAVLIALGGADRQTNDLQELSGLYQRRPVLAAAMAACVFSLAGIPPLAGFCGKLALFMSSIDLTLSAEGLQVRSWFGVLSVAAALNAAIAAAYYLRIISVMYFGDPPRPTTPVVQHDEASVRAVAPAAVACLCAFLVVVAGVLPGPLFRQAESAGAALQAARGVPSVDVAKIAFQREDSASQGLPAE